MNRFRHTFAILLCCVAALIGGCSRSSMAPPPPLTPEVIGARFGLGTVRSFAWNDDLTMIACGGDVGRLYLIDVRTNRFVAVIERGCPISAVKAAGPFILVAGRDGNVVAYDWQGNHKASWGPLGSPIVSLAVSPERALAGCENGHLVLLDLRAEHASERVDVAAQSGAVNAVALSADGRQAFSAGDDGIVREWSAAKLTAVRASSPQNSPVLSMTFWPEANRLVIGCKDGGVRVMEAGSLKVERRMPLRDPANQAELKTPVWSVATLGTHVAAGTTNQRVVVWDYAHEETPNVLYEHQQGTVYCLSLDMDMKMAAGGDSRIVLLTSLQPNAKGEPRELGHQSATLSVACSPDNRYVASVGSGPDVCIWEVSSASLLRVIKTPAQGDAEAVAWARDGHLAVGTEDGQVCLMDRNGKPVGAPIMPGSMPQQPVQVNDVTFSPDSKLLASAGWDREIHLWNVTATGLTPAGELKGHTNGISAIAFSPDGKNLASSSWDQTVRYWDVETRSEKLTLSGMAGPVFSVALGGAHQLIAGGWKGQTWVWNVTDGSDMYRKEVQKDVVFRVAVSPDGKWVASGSADRSVEIYSAEESMSPIANQPGFRGSVRGLSWMSTSDRLAVGTLDGNVFLITSDAAPVALGAPPTKAAPSPTSGEPATVSSGAPTKSESAAPTNAPSPEVAPSASGHP